MIGAWTGQGESRYKLYCGWGSGLVGRETACGLATGRVARQAMTQPGRRATRRNTPATRHVLGLRHGTLRATTRCSARATWAQCAWPGRNARDLVWVLILRGRKIHLLPTRERNIRLLFRTDLGDRAKVIRTKARMGHLVRQGR